MRMFDTLNDAGERAANTCLYPPLIQKPAEGSSLLSGSRQLGSGRAPSYHIGVIVTNGCPSRLLAKATQ